MGMMLESHLQGGKALSITDPCLDWESTEELLLNAHSKLKTNYNSESSTDVESSKSNIYCSSKRFPICLYN